MRLYLRTLRLFCESKTLKNFARIALMIAVFLPRYCNSQCFTAPRVDNGRVMRFLHNLEKENIFMYSEHDFESEIFGFNYLLHSVRLAEY